ncbi:SWITCH/sucrose nonfermenting 3A [Hibiscus trionum]|uniref:SWITCH/sucrose nonfermenting 3A n=1 Tax=Hibiscus trionum TaxID=183268 RepID=A0A9W7MFR3_HIBTR|nr:SWITCH/sucrose nonfermenting 3A [Hibiscus trionum]
MENKPRHDPNPDSTRPEEPELDLYTIPSYSSWFAWNDIHETERQALKEFFEGSSISRTPKVYKDYRDFIINKYREHPSRRLNFTGIRKSLIGDVTLLHKVFRFLETWGLINFVAPPPPRERFESDDRVRVENGAPTGVRVVATPNSLRPLSAPVVKGKNGGDGVEESGVKLPPLASYSDVFGDLKRLHCGNCGDNCDSGYYECKKDDFVVCVKCFKSGNYGEGKSMDDFELKDCSEKSTTNVVVWTDAETLLLLDSVLEHGGDWDLVAQNVQTKSKLDCITKLIELPFGESLIDSSKGRGNSSSTSTNTTGIKPVCVPSSEPQENTINEDQGYDGTNENEKNGDSENQEPPLKKKRTASISDADSSLMKQVARISTMVEPQITAAAAEAAVASLSDEMSCPREIFYGDLIDLTYGSLSPTLRAHDIGESEIMERSSPSESQELPPKKSGVPLPLRIRAAVATGLGAAAARAKLLAVQEEREIEHLVATIIEAQLKKLQSKVEHCDDAKLLMEKEYAVIEDRKEHILGERINTLQMTYNTGTSKLLEHSSVQSQTSNLN